MAVNSDGYPKVCAICGKDFRTQSRKAIYCSQPCKNKAEYRKKAGK